MKYFARKPVGSGNSRYQESATTSPVTSPKPSQASPIETSAATPTAPAHDNAAPLEHGFGRFETVDLADQRRFEQRGTIINPAEDGVMRSKSENEVVQVSRKDAMLEHASPVPRQDCRFENAEVSSKFAATALPNSNPDGNALTTNFTNLSLTSPSIPRTKSEPSKTKPPTSPTDTTQTASGYSIPFETTPPPSLNIIKSDNEDIPFEDKLALDLYKFRVSRYEIASTANQWQEAEGYIHEILLDLSPATDTHHIDYWHLQLAIALHKQDKHIDAYNTLSTKLSDSSTSLPSILVGKHYRLACHALAVGQLDDAKRYGMKTLSMLNKYKGEQASTYHECVYLMANIHRRRGEVGAMQFYLNLLPDGYVDAEAASDVMQKQDRQVVQASEKSKVLAGAGMVKHNGDVDPKAQPIQLDATSSDTTPSTRSNSIFSNKSPGISPAPTMSSTQSFFSKMSSFSPSLPQDKQVRFSEATASLPIKSRTLSNNSTQNTTSTAYTQLDLAKLEPFKIHLSTTTNTIIGHENNIKNAFVHACRTHDPVLATIIFTDHSLPQKPIFHGNRTMLHKSVTENSNIITQLLLSLPLGVVDVNTTDNDNTTPLHLAARLNRLDILETLLEAGADVSVRHKHGMTALHMGALSGSEEVVRALIKYGCNVNALDTFGKSAYALAKRENFRKLAKMLKDEFGAVT